MPGLPRDPPPGKHLAFLQAGQLVDPIVPNILHQAMLQGAIGLGLGHVAQRGRKDLALQEFLGLGQAVEEQRVALVDMRPQDVQPWRLGAAVLQVERPVVVEAALDGVELFHLPAPGGVLQRESPSGCDGLRKAHRRAVHKPLGGGDVDIRSLLCEPSQELAVAG